MSEAELLERISAGIDPEAIARDVLDFVAVRSETGEEGPGSDFLAELLERHGFEPELDDAAPGRPNVYARLPGRSPEAPVLLLNGHTDTIPVGAATPPRREGEWLVGRGTEDMKGGLVAMVHAGQALRSAGLHLRGDLWLTGVVGHETPVGKKEGPRRLIERLAAGRPRADGILIVEGPHALWCASLGSAVFEIRITSPRGAIHTLHVPYSENPACWLGRLLLHLEQMDSGFETAGHHPLCGRARLNVGTIHGGDYMNRLPTPIIVTGQRRWTPGQDAAEALAELRSLCEDLSQASGLEFAVTFQGVREPFETPEEHPLVRAAAWAGDLVLGEPPPRIGMALVGDANLYANEGGVPTIYFGPEYRTAHSDDERVSLARLAACARIYAMTAVRFCGLAEG